MTPEEDETVMASLRQAARDAGISESQLGLELIARGIALAYGEYGITLEDARKSLAGGMRDTIDVLMGRTKDKA